MVATYGAPGSAMLIGDEWVSGSSGTYPVINPATEEVIAEAPEASSSDVEAAVAAAREAQPAWAALRPEERGRLLTALADRLEQRGNDLLPLLASEMGGTMRGSAANAVQIAVLRFRAYAEIASKFDPLVPMKPMAMPAPDGSADLIGAAAIRRPYGVVGCITASNFPLIGAAGKIGPALAVGNTVVLKPAPQDPLGVLELARICTDVGLPAGVVNVVTGAAPTVGAEVVASPEIDMISFTGRPVVGASIYQAGALTMKHMLLELGGKGAILVFEDADVASAVEAIASVWMIHSGQVCAAPTRALVHESLHDELLRRLSDLAASLVIGPPEGAATVVGPVLTAGQRDSIEAYISKGVSEGATLAAGGERPLDTGYYVAPTLLAGCDNSMTPVREEIFGPVVTMQPFRDEDEAISLCNDTDFGLANYVYSTDAARAWRVANQLDCGMVMINSWRPRYDVPFGGRKMSGIGREGTSVAVESYTELQGIAWKS